MSPIRNLFRPLTSRLAGRAHSSNRRARDRRPLGAEPLEQRMLLAADIAQVFSSVASIDYTVGARIPIQVMYSEPVVVSGGPMLARVANGSPLGGSAAFTGVTMGGLLLNFDYIVAAGDNVKQFDVLLDPTQFIVGGVITTISDLKPADRMVDSGDLTLKHTSANLGIDTTAPVMPRVTTTYVNPLAHSTSSTWAALHPNYFVIRGTAGTTALPAGETLSVLVNGATFRPTVGPSGEWAVFIRSLGTVPASMPVSGSLQPWSTTNGDAYDVVATITDGAGNHSTDSSTSEIVIDMDRPEATGYFADPAQASYRAGQTISMYVQYDEPVRVVGTPTLSLDVIPGPAVATFDPVATAAWAPGDRVYFFYTVLPGDSASPLDVTALNLNGGVINDLAANEPADPTALGTGNLGGITIDTTAPTLTEPLVSTLSPIGTYVVGSPAITITVTFSEVVFVAGGSPELALNSGLGAKATYASGSGTNTLSFTYSVLAGHRTPALDYTSTTALSLNGATIADAAGNAATLTLPGPNSGDSFADKYNFVIVATPTVIHVKTPLLKGAYTAGQIIPIWVLFTEVVDVLPGPFPTLLLNTLPNSSAAIWKKWIDAGGAEVTTPTNTLLFEYLVQPGDTTTGQFLNYASINALQPGAGIGHAWIGQARPQFLAANLSLPVIGSSLGLLPYQISIAPDTLAPPKPFLSLNDTGYFATDRVTNDGIVAVANIESRATWEFSVDAGANWNPGSGTNFTIAEGSYPPGTIWVRQIDWSGNVGRERRLSPFKPLVVDLTPPPPPTESFSDTGISGDGITRDGTVTVGGLDASPPTGSIRYSIDGGISWTVLFPGVTSFVLPAGIYQNNVLVTQQDLAGNASPAVQIPIVEVRNKFSVATPTIALRTDAGWYDADGITNDPSVTVGNIEVDATWEYSTNSGSSWATGSNDAFDLSHGTYAAGTVVVRQTDLVGNTASIANTNIWQIDRIPPAPPIVSFNDTGISGDGITRDGTIMVGGLDTSPPTGSIRYSINGGTSWTVLFPGVTSFVLPAGTYLPGSVQVAQQDLAGNISPPVTIAVTDIVIKTSVAKPVIGLAADTGVSNSDFITNNPRVAVADIEDRATWEYSTNSGSSWATGSGNAFDLSHGTYAAGTVVVRQTDLVGNTASTSNTQPWVIDLVDPAITVIAALPGRYMAGSVIPITVTFGEMVFPTGAPTLALSTGREAVLAGPLPSNGTTTMTFNYLVQVNDASPALQVTSFNLAASTSVGDRAGNPLKLPLVNPITLAGPVVVDANVGAFSPIYGSDPAAPLLVNAAVTRIPIRFTTPVRNFQLGSIRLFWNGGSMSLKGARLAGSGGSYTLVVPRQATNLRGTYRLEIMGPRTGIESITGGLPMTGTSNIYWRRV